MFCSETQRGAFTCSPSALTTKPMLLRRARRSAYPTRCSPSCNSRSACGCLKFRGDSSLRRAPASDGTAAGLPGDAGVGAVACCARGVEDAIAIDGGESKSESCERASSAGPVRGMGANSNVVIEKSAEQVGSEEMNASNPVQNGRRPDVATTRWRAASPASATTGGRSGQGSQRSSRSRRQGDGTSGRQPEPRVATMAAGACQRMRAAPDRRLKGFA